jgi:hypothetical protein
VGRIRVVALLLVLAFACKTDVIVPRAPIAVPAGLTPEQIEIAILAAISGNDPGMLLRQAERPDGGGIEAVHAAVSLRRMPSGTGWYAELIEPGEIWASYFRGRHRLNVAIRYTASEVRTRITGSENLRQEDGVIHKNALVWLTELERRIGRSLQALAALPARPAAGP